MSGSTRRALLWLLTLLFVAAVALAFTWPRGVQDCRGLELARDHLPDISQSFQFVSDDGEQQAKVVLLYQPVDNNVFSHRSLVQLRELHEELEALLLNDQESVVLRLSSLSNAYIQFPDQRLSRIERLIPDPIPLGAGMLNAIALEAGRGHELEWRFYSPDWSYGTLILHTEPLPRGDTGMVRLAEALYTRLSETSVADHFSFYLLAPEWLYDCSR